MGARAPRAPVRIEEGIARIAIDDGKVNALSAELMAEIGEALDAAAVTGTKRRVNERAIAAVRSAADDEIRAAFGR